MCPQRDIPDIPCLIAMYRAGRLSVDLLRSSIIAHEEVNAAFDRLDRGKTVAAKLEGFDTDNPQWPVSLARATRVSPRDMILGLILSFCVQILPGRHCVANAPRNQ
jgi:hypothetical protein